MYDFAASGEGQYTISARNLFHHVDDDNTLIPITATSETHKVSLSGKLTAAHTHSKRAPFPGCSEEEQSMILAAAVAARALVDQSLAQESFTLTLRLVLDDSISS